MHHEGIELTDPTLSNHGNDVPAQGEHESTSIASSSAIAPADSSTQVPPSGSPVSSTELALRDHQLEEDIDPELLKGEDSDDPNAPKTATPDGQDDEKKEEEKPEEKAVPMKDLWRYATNFDGFILFWGVVGALVNGLAMPLFSLLLGDLTDEIQAGNMDRINEICLWLVYLGIAGFAAGFCSIGFFMLSAERQGKRIREEYFRSILSQDITWHDVVSAADLASKITAYTRRFQDGLGDKLVLVIQNASGLVFALGLSLYKGWELTLILLCPAPVMAIFSALMAVVMTDSMSNEQSEYAQANTVAQESLDAIKTVHSNQMELSFIQRYNQSLQVAYQQGLRKMYSMGAAMGAFYLVIFSVYALGLFYGGVLIRRGAERWPNLSEYSGGTVISIFYTLLSGVMMMGQVGPHISAIIGSRVAAYELYSVIDRKSEINPLIRKRDGIISKDDVTGRIKFVNVSFRYPARPEALVLDNINHTFESGQMTALCGGSGSGKSTIIQLIERFYDPTEGDVMIELYDRSTAASGTSEGTPPTKWVNLKDVDIASWRRVIGLVSQEPILWAGTIMENIRYGKADATDEEIIAVAKAANAHNFIMKKKDGYQSPVGENGGLLSGGEKQRVSIARSLIMRPTLLIFDEATSALDNHSEKLVQKTIDELVESGKYTAIAVAHRLSTIRAAKTIVCMGDGKILEYGTHDELVELGGVYYSMLNAQLSTDSNSTPSSTLTTPNTSPRTSGAAIDSDTVLVDHANSGDNDDDIFEGSTMRKLREANLKSKPKSSRQKKQHKKHSGDDKTTDTDDNETDDQHTTPSGAKRRQDFIRFVKFTLKTQWKWILTSTICAGGVGAAFPIYSFLMSRAVRAFYYTDHSEMKSLVNSYAGYFVALGAGAGIFELFHLSLIGVAGERILRLFRSQVYDSILRQDMGFHDSPRNSSGILTTKLAADTVYIRALLTEFYATSTSVLVTVLSSFIIGFTIDWKMTLVMLLVFPILTGVGILQMSIVSGFGSKSKENLEAAGVVASESVRNIRTVASFNGETRIQEKFRLLLEEALKIGTRSAIYAGLGFAVTQFSMFASYSFAFWIGGKLVSDGKLEFSSMLQVFLMVEMAAMMASQVFTQAIHLERASAAITDMYEIIDRIPVRDIRDLSGARPAITSGKVEFKNVHFHYPTRKDLPILKGVTFVAEPPNPEDGYVLAVVGESGGGKSTTFGLVQRFYDTIQPNGDERYHIDHPDGSVGLTMTTTEIVTDEHGNEVEQEVIKAFEPRDPRRAGEIFIDGYNINEMNLTHLRQYIGVVEQEPKLFRGTIRENILAGKTNITEDEMIAAARMANIHDLIMRLPKQYDTVIDSKKVSGGQKQRIAIARSLVRKPKLLLLDEAVSALDNKSMMLVQDALNKAMKGRTTLVIAHRLETIKTADKIVVLSEGVIAEEGTHDELIAKNGVYAHLVGMSQAQSTPSGDDIPGSDAAGGVAADDSATTTQ